MNIKQEIINAFIYAMSTGEFIVRHKFEANNIGNINFIDQCPDGKIEIIYNNYFNTVIYLSGDTERYKNYVLHCEHDYAINYPIPHLDYESVRQYYINGKKLTKIKFKQWQIDNGIKQ